MLQQSGSLSAPANSSYLTVPAQAVRLHADGGTSVSLGIEVLGNLNTTNLDTTCELSISGYLEAQ
jgi:hypothetical protein